GVLGRGAGEDEPFRARPVRLQHGGALWRDPGTGLPRDLARILMHGLGGPAAAGQHARPGLGPRPEDPVLARLEAAAVLLLAAVASGAVGPQGRIRPAGGVGAGLGEGGLDLVEQREDLCGQQVLGERRILLRGFGQAGLLRVPPGGVVRPHDEHGTAELRMRHPSPPRHGRAGLCAAAAHPWPTGSRRVPMEAPEQQRRGGEMPDRAKYLVLVVSLYLVAIAVLV